MAKCKECGYAGVLGSIGVYCNYMAVEGKRRGCEGGEACTKQYC